MTFTELLSELDKLSWTEKLRVIRHLALELEHAGVIEEAPLAVELGREYEVWSPQDEGGAVSTLQKLLQEHDKGKNAQ